MSKNLLSKTTSRFLTFSVLVLLVSAPVFYQITKKLYQLQIDEVLLVHKKDFVKRYQDKMTPADAANWNRYNWTIKIEKFQGVSGDRITNKTYYNFSENENEPYRELKSGIVLKGMPYTYVEKSNLLETEDLAMSIAILFLLVISILLVSMIWISKVASAALWKPFYDTLAQIRDFEIDKNKKPKFGDTNIAEFDTLNQSIHRLIEKNRAIYKNQKVFIENAAHELQTPLALFQTKIDTLLQVPGISEAQSVILDSLNKDISRLNRLNKNLLLLSKIENATAPEKETLVLTEYITKQFDFFSEQAKAKNLSLSTAFSETLAVESNPEFTEILINNLFLNAIRHNQQDGRIIITTTGKTLVFSNNGPEKALNAEKLFYRFSKLNPSSNGNGLGLAIVKKIADLND